MVYAFSETYTMSTPTVTKRQRKKPALTRMNLMVNHDHLRKLMEIYGVKTESEAARRAHELVVLGDETMRIAERIRALGGLDEPLSRRNREPLPVVWPEDEAGDEVPRVKRAPAKTSRRR